jgi:hypothetical protein
MDYKYTDKSGKPKVKRIPDSEIERNMKILKISKDEAIQMYLEDEGILINEEQNALDQKAKDSKITATIHQARADYKPKTQRERVVKEDKVKEEIIKAIADLLPSLNAVEVKIENVGKLITFKLGEDKFKIDLVRQRPPKKK